MKKLVLMAAVMLASVGAYAQHAVGSLTFQPKVGMNIANFSEGDADSRIGLVAGVEGEYQLTDILSLSAGAVYSMQGAKMTVSGMGQSVKTTTKLDYVNVPVMANVYVVKGLAVKLGVQPGFKVNGKVKTNVGIGSKDIKAKTVDFSVPVGLSYEYENFQIDARYNWGVSKAFKYGDAKNNVFQITLGYKFEL